MSVCSLLKKDNEVCTEDFECGITNFCWYATKEDRVEGTKRCVRMYSQENGEKFGWYGETTVGANINIREETNEETGEEEWKYDTI